MLPVLLTLVLAQPGTAGPPTFPRIANLWGVSANSKEYGRWAKYDLLVMGGASAEAWKRFGAEVRKRNPRIVLLGTGQFMNLVDPKTMPWMKDEWYVRRPDGTMVKWWADMIVLPNITRDDCLDALVENVAREYDALLKDGTVDGLFFDSVVGRATWLGDVDTDGDGKADDPATIDPIWHARQCLFFDRLRQRWPKAMVLANDVDLGHARHLHGRLFEGMPLLERVTQGTLNGMDAVRILSEWQTASLQPALTFAIMTHPLGWQNWRVGKGERVTTKGEQERVRRDFRRMRAGLAMTLMTDCYYANDFGTTWYGLPWRYAEYDAKLGKALGPAREVSPAKPPILLDWRAGKPIGPIVLDPDTTAVKPAGIEVRRDDRSAGWARVIGTNPDALKLKPGKAYRIEADCSVLTKPSGTLQFNARTATGGWENHDKGRDFCSIGDGGMWRINTVIIPDDYPDYSIEWHLHGAATFLLTRLRVTDLGATYLRRDFERGVALFNPLPHAVTVRLLAPICRLRDAAAPLHALEVDDLDPGFATQGAWERKSEEGRYVGLTHRAALKPGSKAHWTFTAPAADRYAIYACLPGGENLTAGAAYQVTGADGRKLATAVVDQRKGDGGWVKLFEAPLRKGERCRVTVASAGMGVTVADAILAESAARFNDGALVREITLAPQDGVVLVMP